jgi:2-polyprenyl-6-hydroxyphenyl methylase/3-demethylubiquinone-9 3-methyltransferase
MAIIIDPEQNEVRALERVADWRHKQVLEIGCGGGRLTLRLARLGAIVHAVDADADSIDAARQSQPRRSARQVSYHVGEAEHLPIPDEIFDLAIFSWAL